MNLIETISDGVSMKFCEILEIVNIICTSNSNFLQMSANVCKSLRTLKTDAEKLPIFTYFSIPI